MNWVEVKCEMEQDPLVLPAVSSTCVLSVENLQPKIKFREVRQCRSNTNSQTDKNNSLVIK